MFRKGKLFKKILVAVDGSEQANKAAHMAARLASDQGAELILLHVVDKLVIDELKRFVSKAPDALEKELEEQAWALLHSTEILLQKYRVPVKLILKEGIPYQQIIEATNEEGVDLIIMGKIGKRGVKKLLMGSAAFRVLEFTTVPVLVVE